MFNQIFNSSISTGLIIMGSIILIIAIVQTYIIGFHLKEYAYDNEGSIMFFVYLAGIVFFIIKAYSYFTFLI